MSLTYLLFLCRSFASHFFPFFLILLLIICINNSHTSRVEFYKTPVRYHLYDTIDAWWIRNSFLFFLNLLVNVGQVVRHVRIWIKTVKWLIKEIKWNTLFISSFSLFTLFSLSYDIMMMMMIMLIMLMNGIIYYLFLCDWAPLFIFYYDFLSLLLATTDISQFTLLCIRTLPIPRLLCQFYKNWNQKSVFEWNF